MSDLPGLRCGYCGSTDIYKPKSLLARILMLENSVRCRACKRIYSIEFCEAIEMSRSKRAGSFRDYDE